MLFPAMHTMETSYIWSGIIWVIVMGLAAGNYACSLIHRLPRGRLLLDKAPYCGTCGELLQVKDLFPVVSAVLLGHKCRYCKTPFPISHTVTEIVLASVFVLSFLRFGFSDITVLLCTISSFLVVLSAIEVNEKLVMGKVMICVGVVGMITRAYLDHDIFNFMQGGLYGLILGAIVWRKGVTKDGHIYRLPKQAELMAMAGICVGGLGFVPFLAMFAISYIAVELLSKSMGKEFRITIAFSAAIVAALFIG